MNPYDEKRLRDEVIYLHSLWHQGPPQNPNPIPQKRPRPLRRNPTNKSKRLATSGSYPPPKPDNGPDWSTLVKPPPPSSPGWPEPKCKPDHPTKPVSVEDQARFSSLKMQSKVLESCKEFFNKRVVDDEESQDEEEEEEEEEDGEEDKFFMGIFVNNSDLRGYYEENHEKGEFFCLVCGGIGENVGKKFKGCVGLVQHCMSILKTKRKRGHRAFGLVVCKVLGWDIDRLPVILLKGEPLSRSLADLTQDKGDDLNFILGTQSVNADGSESVENEVSGIDQSNCELMIPSAEWPCIEPIDESTSTIMGWPSFEPCTAPVTLVVPAEEQTRFNIVQLQRNVFEGCKHFLSTTDESDSDENDSEVDDEDEDDLMDEDGSIECKEFNFFLRLFTENNELRSYYETNCRGGDFCCLVCCGIGKKVWRTFKDCVGLLQHSTAISKTKKKRAHRAFGLVICKVLGWDIDRLPSIVLKSEPLSHSLEDLSQRQLDGKVSCDKDELDGPTDKTDSGSALEEDINAHQNNSALISSESTLNEEPNKDNNLENIALSIGAN
ncbi:uncharacterized protein LOC110419193 isoform X2 [Herrania umbratica]|uniref:Uncharacterized protein LOC110419193 isoform X2 n=1 Tax=Herrania umbratica TaxID=108875 RepID=A0A6J1AKU8_9ROSI|nr:uncharacterized protein LOC110419193 isoform X2 [Herrania umbratica]